MLFDPPVRPGQSVNLCFVEYYGDAPRGQHHEHRRQEEEGLPHVSCGLFGEKCVCGNCAAVMRILTELLRCSREIMACGVFPTGTGPESRENSKFSDQAKQYFVVFRVKIKKV